MSRMIAAVAVLGASLLAPCPPRAEAAEHDALIQRAYDVDIQLCAVNRGVGRGELGVASQRVGEVLLELSQASEVGGPSVLHYWSAILLQCIGWQDAARDEYLLFLADKPAAKEFPRFKRTAKRREKLLKLHKWPRSVSPPASPEPIDRVLLSGLRIGPKTDQRLAEVVPQVALACEQMGGGVLSRRLSALLAVTTLWVELENPAEACGEIMFYVRGELGRCIGYPGIAIADLRNFEMLAPICEQWPKELVEDAKLRLDYLRTPQPRGPQD